MQQPTSEVENRAQGSQFSNKMPQIDPSFSVDYLKQQQADNVSIYELEQNELIENVRRRLAGEIFDPQSGRWISDPSASPPMNKRGVHHFMIKFGGHLDKNITLSDIDLKKIYEMMLEVTQDILEIFWKKAYEFNIKRENMNFILHILEHHIFANYMRAKDGGERKHRETVIKSIESIRDVQQQPRSATRGFNFANPFGLGRNKGGDIYAGH